MRIGMWFWEINSYLTMNFHFITKIEEYLIMFGFSHDSH